MFTGIVREVGTVVNLEEETGLVRLTVEAPGTAPLTKVKESVAVNGCCLTAVDVTSKALVFEAIEETQRLTNIGALRPGSRVNLEPSLGVQDRFHGHMVYGHIDGVATILEKIHHEGQLEMRLKLSPELRRSLVPKGPIAVDGISLTLAEDLGPDSCGFYLIPETLKQTTLGDKALGDPVNIELDYVAKLVEQFVASLPRS